MRMLDVILAKRSGKKHSRDEIKFLIDGVMDRSIPDYQLSSWLMAVCWRGMELDECAWLTDAMCHSGQVLDLSDVGPLVGDKHSTGGVGDKTTLVFVPLLCAAGIPMAKLSGRGLGHTGGTIDKLEAIPGFKVDISIEHFIEQVKKIGMAIAGQTAELAPADGHLYAMRDVTGTVESIPLIAASIVSKKMAAGTNLIILDVKCGKGAFMDTEEKAVSLAKTMAAVGRKLNRPVLAVVTDMEQPLGMAVGHTTEVIEAIETLKGRGPHDLIELCMELGSLALVQAGKAKDVAEAVKKLQDLISSGEALKTFGTLISAQGGDARVLDNYSLMPTAKMQKEFLMPATIICDGQEKSLSGKQAKQWIGNLDGKKVAEACKIMGAGRAKKGDPIDLAVGVVLKAKVGDAVEVGQSLATVHCQSEEQYKQATAKLIEAYTFSGSPVLKSTLIKASIT
ncbi:MAG: thymidine phosphorylase [Cyanobacteria bacterium REEB67]|nr:thymidine phosphorylase [Cyanobacteria bacterium REEB67]